MRGRCAFLRDGIDEQCFFHAFVFSEFIPVRDGDVIGSHDYMQCIDGLQIQQLFYAGRCCLLSASKRGSKLGLTLNPRLYKYPCSQLRSKPLNIFAFWFFPVFTEERMRQTECQQRRTKHSITVVSKFLFSVVYLPVDVFVNSR